MVKRASFRRRKPRGRGKMTTSKVKKIIEGVKETKFRDTLTITNDTGPILGTGTVVYASGTAQGDTTSSRDGNSIMLKSFQMKGNVRMDLTAAAAGTIVRVLVVRALKNVNGVLPTIAEIFNQDEVNAFRLWSANRDFKVYMDKTIIMNRETADTMENIRKLKFYKAFKKPIEVSYTSTTDAIGDAMKNSFYIVRLCNRADTFQAEWNFNTRITYVED